MRKVIVSTVIAGALAAGQGAAASSAAASLSVSVTVVRSCAVQARPIDGETAAVRIRCSSGHESSVLVSDGQLAAPRGVVHVEETGDGEAGSALRTVTLNF